MGSYIREKTGIFDKDAGGDSMRRVFDGEKDVYKKSGNKVGGSMKKVSGTRRLMAVVLTIAMLLQNSAGVLATDGANAVSNLSQEQSTEQPGVNAASEQTDAGAQDGENTDASKKNEAPETTAPETQAPQTDAPETAVPETQAPQTDAPQTNAPETQEMPGLTQPDSGTDNGTNDNGTDSRTEFDSVAETNVETNIAETGTPETGNTETETNSFESETRSTETTSPEHSGIVDINIAENGTTGLAATEFEENLPIANAEEYTVATIKETQAETGKIAFILHGGDFPDGNIPENMQNVGAAGESWNRKETADGVEYSIIYNKGITLPKPDPSPVKEGFVFAYWYHGDTPNKDEYNGKDEIENFKSSSRTLHAAWKVPDNYKVTYEPQGGTITISNEKKQTSAYTVQYTKDSSGALPEIEREDIGQKGTHKYVFLGYFTSPADGEKIENIDQAIAYAKKNNVDQLTLYARWQAEGQVRYWLDDVDPQTGARWDPEDSNVVIENDPKKESEGYSGPYYIDERYYSNKESHLYGVSQFKIPGGTPERPGYIFDGWVYNKQTGIKPNTGQSFDYPGDWQDTKSGKNFWPDFQTYHAGWSEVKATLTYQTETTAAGTVSVTSQPGNASETIGAVTGTPVGATAVPNPGYHFVKWTAVVDGALKDFSDAVLSAADIDMTKDHTQDVPGIYEGGLYQSVTFTAVFEPNIYEVEFNKNNADATGEMANQTYTFGTPQPLAANMFSRHHYEFAGWALKASSAKADYADGASFVINSANIQSLNIGTDNTVTLYALWKESKPAKITYVLNGRNETVDGAKIKEVFNSSGNKESYWPGEDHFTLEKPVYRVIPTDGSGAKEYTFDGWYSEPDFRESSKKTEITLSDRGDITVYAKWKAVGRVRYYLDASDANWNLGDDSGRIVPESTGSKDKFIDVIDNYTNGTDDTLTGVQRFTIPQNAPTRTGYCFVGWFHSSISKQPVTAGSGTYNFPYPGDFDPTESGKPDRVTFHAQWNPYTYQVVFDQNLDGQPGGTDQTVSQLFTYDTQAKLNDTGAGNGQMIANFTRKGYTFLGWAKSPDAAAAEYQNGDIVSNWEIGSKGIAWETNSAGTVDNGKFLTLYAVWKASSYTVKFDPNVQNLGEVTGSMAEQEFVYDLAQNLNSNQFKRTGYTFEGWMKTANGSNVDYQDQASVKNLTDREDGEVTLYARWTPKPYTVTFHKNDGAVPESTKTVTFRYGTKYKLNGDSATFERTGYRLLGWATAKEGTEVVCTNDAEVSDWKATEGAGQVLEWNEANGFHVDLYAVWGYSIKFHINTGGTDATVVEETAEQDGLVWNKTEQLRTNSFEVPKKTFMGWMTRPDGKQTEYEDEAPVRNLTVAEDGYAHLYARWFNNYTVTYVLNGKTEGAYTVTNPSENLEEYTAGVTKFDFRNPHYEIHDGDQTYEYQFLGWYTVNEGGEQKTGITLDDSGDITVYARWRAEGRLRYWLHASDETETITWELGSDANIEPDTPKLSTPGYRGPYYIDQDYYNSNIENKNEKTVYGKADFRIPEAKPVRIGYDFDYWYTESKNNLLYDMQLEPGETYEFQYSGSLSEKGAPNTLTLHAHWTPYTYSAKFYKNAGETKETIKTESFRYGEKGTLGEVVFEREGYTFMGWATSRNGQVLFTEGIPVKNWKAGPDGNPLVSWKPEKGASVELYAIWKPEFDIKVSGFDVVYDGQPHKLAVEGTIEGDTVTYSYTVNGQTKTVTDPVTATNVSESAGKVKVTVARGGEEYTQTVDAVIRKRPVTLKSESLEKEFDGEPLTNGSKPLVWNGRNNAGKDTGWVEGEGLNESKTEFRGTITNPGTAANEFTYVLTDQTNSDNYNINVEYGTLTVRNRSTLYEITVKASSGTRTYNGTAQSVSGFESLNFEVAGHSYKVEGLEANGSGTNAGTYEVSVSGTAIVKDAAGNDVTKQFNVNRQEGTLTIVPRALTLTSASDTKTYDGTALTNHGVTVSAPGFAGSDGASYNVTGSQMLQGSSKNTFEYTLNPGTLEQNYTITKVEGTLTVLGVTEKFPIVAEAKSASLMYDGKVHTVSGLVQDTFEFNGQKYTLVGLTASASGTDAGTYVVKVTGSAGVKDAKGNDVTSQFAVTTRDGRLEITRRKVVLESASAAKKYDGKPLTAPAVTVSGDGFVDGEASPSAAGSITYVGETGNTINIGAKSGYKDSNYEITKKEGKLRVTDGTTSDPLDAKLVVSKTHAGQKYKAGDSVTFTIRVKNIYNEAKTITLTEQEGVTFVAGTSGAAVGADGKTAVFSNVAPGAEVAITATYTVTDAAVKNGSFTNNVTAAFSGADKTFRGSDTVDNIDRNCAYTVKFVNRKNMQEIRSSIRSVAAGYGTVVTEDTKGADGTAYKDIRVSGYQYVGSDALTVTTNAEKNVFTLYYEPNLSGIRVEGFKLTYDGKKHTVLVSGTLPGDQVTYSYTVNGVKHNDTSPVSATNANVKDFDGEQLTVTVTVERGGTSYIESVPAMIRRRPVKLQSMSLSKEFDGEPLTNGNLPLALDGHPDVVEVLGPDEGFVDGEGFDCVFTGTVTWPGESVKNTFECTWTSQTRPENYEITYSYGTLKVTNRKAPYEVTVEANSGTFTYDGEQKRVSGLKGENSGAVRFVADGHAYVITNLSAAAEKTDAGTYDVTFTGTEIIRPVEDLSRDVTRQFNVRRIPGILKINPRPVTLQSGSSTKEYDGTPLTNSSVTATGFVGNDGADCTVSGSRILPGSSKNTFAYTLKEGTNAKNYVITKQEGSLTVKDRAEKYVLTVRAQSAAYTYDGTQKTVSGIESLNFTVNGRKYTVEGLTALGSGKDVRKDGYPVEISGKERVLDEFGNDVTAQFTVKREPGTLKINPRPLTLRSADKLKEFDDTPLVNGETPLVQEGWAGSDHLAGYKFTGSQTFVGSSPNTFEYTLGDGTKAENYDITVEYGTLTVVDRGAKYQINVRAKSLTCTYDGTEKSADGFETLTFSVGDKAYTVYGLTARAAGTDAGSYTVEVQGTPTVLDESGNNVTDQFEVEAFDGKLEINRRSVILRSADLEKTYDGKALTNGDTPLVQDGYPDGEFAGEDEGWADGEGYESCSFTGSQTDVGDSENSFTCKLNAQTKESNYNITKEYGRLTVTARTEKYEIDVTAVSGEFLYDGTPKTVSGFVGASKLSRANDAGLAVVVNGRVYTVEGLSAAASGTDAGGYQVTIQGEAKVLDENGKDVTTEFTVNLHDGLLTIHPRELILTSGSAEKKYDGKALTEAELIVEGDGFAVVDNGGSPEPEAIAEAKGSITCVGSARNVIEIRGVKNYKAENYSITLQEGILTVTDGTTVSPLNPAVVVKKTHDTDREYKVGDSVSFTVTATNIYNEEKTLTLTEQEDVSFVEGTSGEAKVTLSADRRTAVFAQVAPGETVTIEAVHVIGDADVEEGSYVNEVTVEFSGPEKTFRGRDTVNKIDRDCTYIVRFVELDATNGTLANNGDLRDPLGPITVKYGTVVDDMTTVGSNEGNGITTVEVEIPYCEIEIPGYKFAGADNPLTVTTNTEENVYFVYYERDASSSRLSVKGVDKTYDGQESSVEVEGLLPDDEVSYTYTVVEDGVEKRITKEGTPSLKDVKDSLGEITVTVKRRDGVWTQKTEATITARRVVLQSADREKIYDGEALTNGDTPLVLDGVADAAETLSAEEGWAQGDSVTYKFTGSQTEVGSSLNTFEVVPGTGTNLDNYKIEKKEGTLTVKKADTPQTESETNAPQTESETNAPQTEAETNTPQTESETSAPQTEPETDTPQTKPDTGVSKSDLAKLTVTKSIINEADRHLLGLDGAAFYVALFSDAKLTKRVSDIRQFGFDLNTAVASVTYKNLKPGTYYVSEVNAGGKPVSGGRYGGGAYAAVYTGDVQKVTIAKGDRSVKFSFENWFLELPDAQYYQDLGLPKDETGEEAESGDKTEKQTESQSGEQPGGQTGVVGEGTEAVKTGDSTPIEWMLLLFAVSGVLLLFAEEKKRRKGRA